MNCNSEFNRAAFAAEDTARAPSYGIVNFQMQVGSAIVFALLRAYVRASGAARAMWRWYAARQTRIELRNLDDRMLEDIGISRTDIPAVSRLSAMDPRFRFRDLPR
jgi:uncharacterized protein YjiS (DUF1127 family)